MVLLTMREEPSLVEHYPLRESDEDTWAICIVSRKLTSNVPCPELSEVHLQAVRRPIITIGEAQTICIRTKGCSHDLEVFHDVSPKEGEGFVQLMRVLYPIWFSLSTVFFNFFHCLLRSPWTGCFSNQQEYSTSDRIRCQQLFCVAGRVGIEPTFILVNSQVQSP
jgi:hypothetical protein